MSEDEILNGCTGVGERPTDFLLEEGDIDNLPTLYQQDDIYFEYNQNAQEWSKKSCTLYNAFGAVSDLMNYPFVLDQIKEMDTQSYQNGRVQGFGWSTERACNLVKNYWNNNEELVKQYGKVAYYRVNMCNDELVNQILDKNYTICWGYQGNSAYQQDYRADAVLDGYDFGKTKTYSHSTALRKINGKKCIKDSYKGRTHNGRYTNIYEVKPTCREEVAGGTFFFWGYLFTKVREDNYEELMRLEKFKTTLNIAMEANSALWHLTNDQKYRDWLHSLNNKHRAKMQDILNEVAKHS